MHLQDGTDDTTPSSATPADDASDISPVDIPHPKPTSVKDNDSAAASSPMANGFHLPNGSAATDSDGFRRQHERRPSAANGRAGVHNRFGPRIPDQQADDSFRYTRPLLHSFMQILQFLKQQCGRLALTALPLLLVGSSQDAVLSQIEH